MPENFEKEILKKGLFKNTKDSSGKKDRTETGSEKNKDKAVATSEAVPGTSESLKVVKFRLEDYEFGVEVSQIEKVVWMVEITRVPNAPGIMEGIIDFQGRLVPVIDLHKILGLSGSDYKKDTQIIITRIKDKILGLIIDKIVEVVTVEGRDIIRPDENIPLKDMLTGVAETPQGLMPIIDLGKVVSLKKEKLKDLADRYNNMDEILQDEAAESEALKKLFHKRAMELAEKREQEGEEHESFLVFAIEQEWYALGLQNIKEELRPFPIVPLPGLPPSVMGVINLRGEILAVVSLKRLFQLSPQKEEKGITRFIVIEKDGLKFCLAVDNVEDIHNFPLNLIEDPLSTLEQSKLNYLKGEINYEGRLIGLLNLENIIDSISVSESSLEKKSS